MTTNNSSIGGIGNGYYISDIAISPFSNENGNAFGTILLGNFNIPGAVVPRKIPWEASEKNGIWEIKRNGFPTFTSDSGNTDGKIRECILKKLALRETSLELLELALECVS